jgi:hypothetical protein
MNRVETKREHHVSLAAFTTLAILLGFLSLLWHVARRPDYGTEMFWFLGALNLNLFASLCVLIEGKTWKRWLLLVLAIPCVLVLADRLIIVTKVLTSS